MEANILGVTTLMPDPSVSWTTEGTTVYSDFFADVLETKVAHGEILRRVWSVLGRPKFEGFIRSEGTFSEVENQQVSSVINDFAIALGLNAWPQIDRLLIRLEFLRSIASQEGEPLKWNSVTDFLRFLASHSWAKYPQVMITPRGTLRAEWRCARNKHFASEFLGDGQCSFVLFANDLAEPERIARISGTVSMRSLLDTVKPHKVLSWIQDGE